MPDQNLTDLPAPNVTPPPLITQLRKRRHLRSSPTPQAIPRMCKKLTSLEGLMLQGSPRTRRRKLILLGRRNVEAVVRQTKFPPDLTSN